MKWAGIIPLFLIIAAAYLPAAEPPPTETPTHVPGVVYVDTQTLLGQVSNLSYGTNSGPWIAVPYNLQDGAGAAGIIYLRFPAGNWGDRNNLKNHQIDQFIELAKRLGAEPSISVRLPGGMPEQAAELVRYTNLEKGYGVHYWSIGNEPSLYDEYDTVRYNAEWRVFAEAMREDGALTVMFINLAPEDKSKPLQVSGISASEPVEIWPLDSDHPAEQVGAHVFNNSNGMVSAEITLPAQSISLYAFP